MSRSQQRFARFIWILLGIVLIVAAYYNGPYVVLPSSLIGWCGGIAFVYAWLAVPDR